jgi:hypothetical protein
MSLLLVLTAEVVAPVIPGNEPPIVGGMRSYAPRATRRAFKRAEDALAKADDIADVAKAVKAAAPAFRGDELASEYAALRLKAERMAREEAALEQRQADVGRAALIMEFRSLMASIAAAAIDDEEAAELLLLAA